MPSMCRLAPGDDEAPEDCPDEDDPLTRTYLNALPLGDELIVPVFNEVRARDKPGDGLLGTL
jgi:hypothetical protein